jgi:hypothetical protein
MPKTAVIAPFQAAMVDALTEDYVVSLPNPEKMRRWEEAERETPEVF